MKQQTTLWIVGAVAIFALVPIVVLFGLTGMPSMAEAQQSRLIVPWLVTWVLISMTAAAGLMITWLFLRSARQD